MKKILKNKKGFTLIELIIVIAVIAILAAIAIPSFLNVIKSAEKADTVSMARNAFSLAQIELLNDRIDGDEATAATALPDIIDADMGLPETHDDITITILTDGYTVTSAAVTANGWTATVTNGDVAVGEAEEE